VSADPWEDHFGLKVDGEIRYRARLHTKAPVFCLAGMWRPETGNWSAAYAALTTETYPDIAPYKDGHVAIVREDDWLDWLQLKRPTSELLRRFPRWKFQGCGKEKLSGQRELFDLGWRVRRRNLDAAPARFNARDQARSKVIVRRCCIGSSARNRVRALSRWAIHPVIRSL
jgi:hypothetical protein